MKVYITFAVITLGIALIVIQGTYTQPPLSGNGFPDRHTQRFCLDVGETPLCTIWLPDKSGYFSVEVETYYVDSYEEALAVLEELKRERKK